MAILLDSEGMVLPRRPKRIPIDTGHADRLARILRHRSTRRTLVPLLGGLTLGRSLASRQEVAQAKKEKDGKKDKM